MSSPTETQVISTIESLTKLLTSTTSYYPILIGSFSDFASFTTSGTVKVSYLSKTTSVRTEKTYTYIVQDPTTVEFTSVTDGSKFTSTFTVWNSGSTLYSFKIGSKTYYTDTKIVTDPTIWDPSYPGDRTLLTGKWTKVTIP